MHIFVAIGATESRKAADLDCLLCSLSVLQYCQVPMPVMLLQSLASVCSAVIFVLYFSIPGSPSI